MVNVRAPSVKAAKFVATLAPVAEIAEDAPPLPVRYEQAMDDDPSQNEAIDAEEEARALEIARATEMVRASADACVIA